MPSISPLTLWNAEVSRYERDLLITTASQGVFLDLVVQQKHVLGSCQLWQIFIQDDIATSLILYKVAAISIVASSELDTPFADVTTTCNASSAIPTNIVKYLKQLAVATDLSEESSVFDCGVDNNWVVGRCGGVAAPYICVNCQNPCQANTSLGYLQSSSSIIWFNSSCVDSTAAELVPIDELFRAFVIDYEDLSVASNIENMATSSPSQNSISVAVTVDEAQGALVCGAFLAPPASIGNLVLQNQLVSIDSLTTSFEIGNLQASTVYDIYCATYSALNVAMTFEKTMETKTEQKTACCREVNVEILQTSFSNAIDQSKVLKISIDSPFPASLNISLRALYYADVTSTTPLSVEYIFSPQSMIFDSLSNSFSQEAAYIANGLAGVYELDFLLGGESESEYALSYTSGSRVTVLEAGTPPLLLR
jgi:hypothetical protein